MYDLFEAEAEACLAQKLVLPAHDYILKCSHAFNLLDARGAISVTERTGYIKRVRRLARLSAEAHLKLRESLGFPLLKDIGERTPFHANPSPSRGEGQDGGGSACKNGYSSATEAAAG